MAGRPRGFEPDEVLQQAMLLFWQNGYLATGIVELERATGLGRQSLYGAFGDKRSLFGSAVDHYFRTVVKPGLIDVLDAPGSARANLERVFSQIEALATAPHFHGCLIGNCISEFGLQDAELAEVLRSKLRLLEAAFYRAIKRAQRADEVSASLDPRATARSLLTTMQGLAVTARVLRERAFVRSVIVSARRLLD